MRIRHGRDALAALLGRQVENLFGLDARERPALERAVDGALRRAQVAFAATRNKYYRDADGEVVFSPLHASQYATFLYFAAREAYLHDAAGELADKLYYLNRALNGCDLYHQVELPAVFAVDHPLGTVLGRARYSNNFFASQGCTVGGNHGIYPTFGTNVALFAGAMVIGRCAVGANVFVSAGSVVKDTDVPDHTVVHGRSPELTLLARPPAYFEDNALFEPGAPPERAR